MEIRITILKLSFPAMTSTPHCRVLLCLSLVFSQLCICRFDLSPRASLSAFPALTTMPYEGAARTSAV